MNRLVKQLEGKQGILSTSSSFSHVLLLWRACFAPGKRELPWSFLLSPKQTRDPCHPAPRGPAPSAARKDAFVRLETDPGHAHGSFGLSWLIYSSPNPHGARSLLRVLVHVAVVKEMRLESNGVKWSHGGCCQSPTRADAAVPLANSPWQHGVAPPPPLGKAEHI